MPSPAADSVGAPTAGAAGGPFQIVLNAGSGRLGADERAATIAGVLEAAGRRFELHPVGDPRLLAQVARDAVKKAAAEGGVIVAAGGDGTIATVAQAALGAPVRFGVVPQGTFNYFARANGIPEDTRAAARVLTDGQERPVQVGLLNGRVFLVNAGLGLYPQLLADRERWKRELGRSRLVALWAALHTLVRANPRRLLRLEHGGSARIVRTSTLVVGNNALQLQQVGIPEGESLDAGLLVGMTARPVSLAGRLALLGRAALGRLGEAPEVDAFAFAKMTVRPARGAPRRNLRVSLDGEVGSMQAPLEFSVAGHRLRQLVPAEG